MPITRTMLPRMLRVYTLPAPSHRTTLLLRVTLSKATTARHAARPKTTTATVPLIRCTLPPYRARRLRNKAARLTTCSTHTTSSSK